MQYLALLVGYGPMKPWDEMTEAEQQANIEGHMAFPAACEALGVSITGGEALEMTPTMMRTSATGDVALTDGPFAEATEHIGGFYVLDAPDFDTAVEALKALPPYDIELRPVADVSGLVADVSEQS